MKKNKNHNLHNSNANQNFWLAFFVYNYINNNNSKEIDTFDDLDLLANQNEILWESIKVQM